jgi:O-antigen ligase
MKELFLIGDNLANRISYYHVMLFLLSLPFDRFFSHIILISFALHTLIHYNKLALKPVFTWRTLILQSVFWVTVISTIYAPNKSLAFGEWGLDISIFLVPIILCINPIDLKKYRQQLLFIFALGLAITIVYLYINALMTIRFYKLPLLSVFSPAFTNHNFSLPIDMHATFFSMQISVALIYILTALLKERKRANRILLTTIGIILLAGIIQLSSKSVFAALVLTINFGFPILLLKGRRRVRFIAVSASITAVIVTIILSSHTFRDRYFNNLRDDVSDTKSVITTEPRMIRWKLAVDLTKQKPVIGHGAGTEIPLLQDQYFPRKFYTSFLHRLNAHNEYLSFLIKSGIWGLMIYLITLAYGLRIAVLKKDMVFFSFMMLLAVVSLSENILDVDKGVMFYSFFFPFFIFIGEQKEKLNLPFDRHKNLRRVATNRMAIPSLS